MACSNARAQADALEIAGKGARVEFFGGLPKSAPTAVLNTNHPSLIGSVVDGILLVVRIGVTSKGVVEESYQMLEGLGGNVLGTLATAADGPVG